jgi:hypothetical protein
MARSSPARLASSGTGSPEFTDLAKERLPLVAEGIALSCEFPDAAQSIGEPAPERLITAPGGEAGRPEARLYVREGADLRQQVLVRVEEASRYATTAGNCIDRDLLAFLGWCGDGSSAALDAGPTCSAAVSVHRWSEAHNILLGAALTVPAKE